jgi:tetratricopeptide (TPR) repeat protein
MRRGWFFAPIRCRRHYQRSGGHLHTKGWEEDTKSHGDRDRNRSVMRVVSFHHSRGSRLSPNAKLQRIKRMPWAAVSFLILVFVSGCSSPRYRSADNALLKGEIRDALAILEFQAREAEENARMSWWPRQHLATASWAYGEASKVALYSGQLQKAVTYGEKSLEMAENIKEVVPKVTPPVGTDELPSIKVRAILQLIQAYRSVRNYQKATELIKRGLPIIKDVGEPAGYLALEGTFYFNLGAILIEQRQYGEAVDAFSASFYLQQGSTGRFAAKQTIPLRQGLAITTLIFSWKGIP